MRNLTGKLLLTASMLILANGAFAQSTADTSALSEIATIVAGINHFPSDGDMTTLEEIIGNSDVSQNVRIIADTVINIEHSANEEGKGAMESIQASSQASAEMKVLAEVIANLSHMASPDAKEQLAQAFP
ncbi:MAG: hypothetical protein AB8B95_05985 [Pseudohongiellaceae bacterium]